MVEKKVKKEEKRKIIFTTGKRKRAIARASIKEGKGVIKINSVPLELMRDEMLRLRIQEPLMIAGDGWKNYNISVNVRGGGVVGQAEAVRLAIAKGLAEVLGNEVRAAFHSYDRHLLVSDPRRTETHKPPRSSQGARRYKQRSKR